MASLVLCPGGGGEGFLKPGERLHSPVLPTMAGWRPGIAARSSLRGAGGIVGKFIGPQLLVEIGVGWWWVLAPGFFEESLVPGGRDIFHPINLPACGPRQAGTPSKEDGEQNVSS